MDAMAVVQRVYDHLDADDVEKAVMACVRLSRGINDYLNAAIFERELHPDKSQVADALYRDMSHLKKEAFEFVWEQSLKKWLELHTLDFVLVVDDETGDEKSVLRLAVGELEGELDQLERSINDLAVPSGMSPYDTAAFSDRAYHEKAGFRLRIKAVQTIKSRLKARCLNYAVQVERQIDLQRKTQSFLEGVQNEVNNYFKSHSEKVFERLSKAAELALSRESEDAALLLAEVRRSLHAAADYFYPPQSGLVVCSDGKERKLGDDQYLNRLDEFIRSHFAKSSSQELLKAEYDNLSVFFRRLNDVASKGVHSTVTYSEARQGLIGLYFFLFNVSQRLEVGDNEEAE